MMVSTANSALCPILVLTMLPGALYGLVEVLFWRRWICRAPIASYPYIRMIARFLVCVGGMRCFWTRPCHLVYAPPQDFLGSCGRAAVVNVQRRPHFGHPLPRRFSVFGLPDTQECADNLARALATCAALGVPVAHHKVEGLSSTSPFWGLSSTQAWDCFACRTRSCSVFARCCP